MEILIKTAQLLLSLSILVIVHEMGHFFAARLFKTRVEKFYIFFNPWFSILKIKKGETTYGLGWLPLGGYVKISGMIDESLDKEQMKQEPQPWEFRSKPAWQRLIIMLGGVLVNVFLAIVIYWVMLLMWGEKYLPTSEVNKYGISVDSLGQRMGLRNGDQIISIDGKQIDDFFKIPGFIILEKASAIQVLREGKMETVRVPEGFISSILKHKSEGFISFRVPFIIDRFSDPSPAKKAGMQIGDRILGINGKEAGFYQTFREEILRHKGQNIEIQFVRENDTLARKVQVTVEGYIGIFNKDLDYYFQYREKKYNFFQAIPAGVVKAFQGIDNYLKQLKLLFSKEVKAYESVGGFISIGSIFPSVWDWHSFWSLTAFLSIMLAILNVLPIPALDGGHVLFLLFEMITGKKPSDKFLEYAQIVGMVLLLALLVFANGNDIMKLFGK